MSQYTSNMYFCNVCGTIKVNLLWIIGTFHLLRLTWVSYQLKTKMGLNKISLISIYLNNDIVMGISL
jgi:hypothetical protein